MPVKPHYGRGIQEGIFLWPASSLRSGRSTDALSERRPL